MKWFILGGLVMATGLGYLGWSERGSGSSDDGEYDWYRFDLGLHYLEVHVGERACR